MHPGAVPEEYLRGLRPFATSDDLRLASLPMGLDPATAAHAAAAAYYHPAYLHHPLTLQRYYYTVHTTTLPTSTTHRTATRFYLVDRIFLLLFGMKSCGKGCYIL